MSLYIFDKDGTLVGLSKKWFFIPTPVVKPEMQVLKPGVFEKIASLRSQGHAIAIATNQKLVCRGAISLEQAEKMVLNCAAKLGGIDAWRICPYDEHAPARIKGRPNPYRRTNNCHKPSPGMLLALMEELGYPREDTIMVGDSWRDRKAAEEAGVRFIKASRFFDTGFTTVA